jgi:hypothetical protein
MTMPRGYVLGDMATKAAYFSVAAAAFIFVAMTLLPGLHPWPFSRATAAAFFDSQTNSLCSAQPRFQEFIGWPLSYSLESEKCRDERGLLSRAGWGLRFCGAPKFR